nr:sugar phosphate nucleotidyltransferase [Rickettsia australis]
MIIAGGRGKRLWPLSSKDKSKQFKKILSDLTLLQQTLTRNKFLGQPTIITSKKYESITQEQAVEIELITEPFKKILPFVPLLWHYRLKHNGLIS